MSITSVAQKYKPIERGLIKDKFTITILDKYHRDKKHEIIPIAKPVILEPNVFFNLKDLGLEETKGWLFYYEEILMSYYKNWKSLNRPNDIIYDIEIKNPDFDKPFYGKIMFMSGRFNNIKNEAVGSYYQIQIPNEYFKQAIDGRAAAKYEYTTDGFVTWIIWLSDSPL